MRRTIFPVLASALMLVLFASVAQAEDKASKSTTGGVVTTETIHVTGRVPRPQVITEVTRITPAQHLTQLRQPLLDRVEQAIDKSPF